MSKIHQQFLDMIAEDKKTIKYPKWMSEYEIGVFEGNKWFYLLFVNWLSKISKEDKDKILQPDNLKTFRLADYEWLMYLFRNENEWSSSDYKCKWLVLTERSKLWLVVDNSEGKHLQSQCNSLDDALNRLTHVIVI